MRSLKKKVSALCLWAAVGVGISWWQAALSAWVWPRAFVPWKTIPGFAIDATVPPLGTPDAPSRARRFFDPPDLGLFGRWVATTFFYGAGSTIFAAEPAPWREGEYVTYYSAGVERSGWPLPCWDAWYGPGDRVVVGVPVARLRQGYPRTFFRPQPVALPVLPVVETVWLSAALWGTAAWGTAVAARRLRDRFRAAPHACRRCGYDRTGLPSGAACPECGV